MSISCSGRLWAQLVARGACGGDEYTVKHVNTLSVFFGLNASILGPRMTRHPWSGHHQHVARDAHRRRSNNCDFSGSAIKGRHLQPAGLRITLRNRRGHKNPRRRQTKVRKQPDPEEKRCNGAPGACKAQGHAEDALQCKVGTQTCRG